VCSPYEITLTHASIIGSAQLSIRNNFPVEKYHLICFNTKHNSSDCYRIHNNKSFGEHKLPNYHQSFDIILYPVV